MSEVPDRDRLEAELARALGKLTRAQLTRLMRHLGNPPRVENVPSGFWNETGQELRKVIGPFIERVYLDQAAAVMGSLPVGVDWTLVNRRAVAWAQTYSYDLVSKLNDTTLNLLRTVVPAYFEEGLTIGDLEARLSGAFGPVRAEMIAVTEVTRAASEGEQALAAELRTQGIDMVPRWQTSNDELVCPLCGPMHDKIITGEYPPAHPRCRCHTTHELRKVKP